MLRRQSKLVVVWIYPHTLLSLPLPPAPEALMQALEDLDYLAALDDDGNLSEVGIIMSELPLEPSLAKALIAACEYDCVDELLTIAAMLTGKQALQEVKPNERHSFYIDSFNKEHLI